MLARHRGACDVLAPVYDATATARTASSASRSTPAWPTTRAGTEAAARELHERIARPNLMVKIPGTEAGSAPIRQMIAEGRNINVTLIFSLDRYAEVMEAYLAGLEAFADDPDADLVAVASVASFFVSRVDTEVDRRLDADRHAGGAGAPGQGRRRPGQAGLRPVPRDVQRPTLGARSPPAGARVQRPLWATTSTKNPAYPDTLYVDELIGPDTVNTLPDATIEAFADHGTLRRAGRRRRRRGARRCGPSWPRSASTSTTSPHSSSARASRASRRASTSCSTRLEAKAAELRAG